MNNQNQNKKTRTSWLELLKYVIRGNEKQFIFAVFTSVLASVFITLTSPLSLKYMFDEGVIRGDFKLFAFLGFVSVIVFTLWRTWVYYNRLYVQKLKINITKQLSKRLVSKYYEIPYSKIIKHDSGYFVSRVYDEAVSTSQPAIDAFLSLFSSLVTLVVATIVVLAMSWRASITIIVSLPLIYLVTRRYSEKIKDLSKVEKEKEANLKGTLTRSISSFKFVNIFTLKSTVLKNIESQFDSYANACISRFQNGIKYEAFNGTLMSYAEIIAIIGAGYEILAGRMSFGSYMAFTQAYWGVIGSIRALFGLVPEISRLVGSAERLIEFEQTEYPKANVRESNYVQLNQIGFSYDHKNILEKIDLKPDTNEKILVVGPNGSGKSTLAHIISGLLSPSFGSMTTFPLSRISAVIYPSEFIPGSINDNFSFISSDIEKSRFEKLCLKFKFDNELGRDPSEFSAGQRKKLEIMMGLVKESDVYVFDEPLAGIDVSSKEIVMDEIFKYTDGKILIVVMHGDEHFHHFFGRKIDLGETNAVLTQFTESGLMVSHQATKELLSMS